MKIFQSVYVGCLVLLLVCATKSACAQLDKNEFVEAVSVLSLDPDSLAAAGVLEQDLEQLWNSIVNEEEQYQAYINKRDQLRTALDQFGNDTAGVFQSEIIEARANLDQQLVQWRNLICVHLPSLALGHISHVAANSEFSVPVYFQVVDWNDSERKMLEQGYTEFSRNERLGRDEFGESVGFYTEMLSRSEVVQAKASFDVRADLYNRSFATLLVALN